MTAQKSRHGQNGATGKSENPTSTYPSAPAAKIGSAEGGESHGISHSVHCTNAGIFGRSLAPLHQPGRGSRECGQNSQADKALTGALAGPGRYKIQGEGGSEAHT